MVYHNKNVHYTTILRYRNCSYFEEIDLYTNRQSNIFVAIFR